MHQHSHIQPHLHTDCAIKVEVKLHFSEQQYWADLRTEAVTILEKVMFSLPSPTNPTTTTATAATIATTTGSSTVESLTEREGRRLEKWLDAIEAVATGGKHTSSAPTTTAATATATTLYDATPHTIRPSTPIAVVSAVPSIPTSHVPNILTPHTYTPAKKPTLNHTINSSSILYSPTTTSSHPTTGTKHPPTSSHPTTGTKHPQTSSHPTTGTKHPPTSSHPTTGTKHPPSSSDPTTGTKHPPTSSHPTTGTKHPPYRFLGLNEETHRDVFYKSLRSDTYTDTSHSAKIKNSTKKTNNSVNKNTTTTSSTMNKNTTIHKPPPLLPQQQHEKEKLKKESQYQTEELQIATLEAELAEVKETFLHPPMLPIECKNTQNSIINTQLSPPLLPQQQQEKEKLKKESQYQTEELQIATLEAELAEVKETFLHPPMLPIECKNTQNSIINTQLSPPQHNHENNNNKERINLSIFKRAGSDTVYQEDRRHRIDKKQQKATINNEKVGFLSGKLRRLQF